VGDGESGGLSAPKEKRVFLKKPMWQETPPVKKGREKKKKGDLTTKKDGL